MAINSAKALITQGKTALMVCDVPEKVSKITFEFDRMISNTAKLMTACKILNVPTIVTEQLPDTLGPTSPRLDISTAKGPFAKSQFSMCTSEVNEALFKICSGNPPESLLLVGLEAHLCVELTAIDLKNKGFDVHVVADCVSARTKEDRFLALERMRDIGCFIGTTENVICKIMRDANRVEMKKIFELFRQPMRHLETGSSSKL